jgi:hypothetical protein
MFWPWFACLCFVVVRGMMSHAILWSQLDSRQKLPPWTLISALVSDFVVPLAIVAAALAFKPVPFNPC